MRDAFSELVNKWEENGQISNGYKKVVIVSGGEYGNRRILLYDPTAIYQRNFRDAIFKSLKISEICELEKLSYNQKLMKIAKYADEFESQYPNYR